MGWINRIGNALFPARAERELDEELRHHMDLRAGERRRAGLDSEAAALEARRMLGSMLHTREQMRDMDVAQWLDTAIKDLRYAFRQMRRSPAFTAVAVVSLALGIGANTGIFSLMNAVLFKSLPVRDPRSLVMLSDPDSAGVAVGSSTGERSLLTFHEYEQLRDRTGVFDGMFASESNLPRRDARINGGTPEDVRVRMVTGGYFAVLGVSPVLGRFFTEAEDRVPGQNPWAVLSYDYWQRRFAASHSALGATVVIGKATLTVIGVAGPRFWGETVGQKPDLWAPMMMQPLLRPGTDWLHEDLGKNPEKVMWLHVFARLKPGTGIAAAQAQADVVFRNVIETGYGTSLSEETRKEFLDQRIRIRPAGRGASDVRGRMSEPLAILLAVVGLVLLIACANIANLMMARAAARGREMGVRVALGASRRRLVRQLLTESLLLSAAGCAAGLLVAEGLITFLTELSSGPRNPVMLETAYDARVLGFTAGMSLLTALLFGLAPALRGTRVDVHDALKEGSRGVTAGARRLTFGRVLVALQVGLSLLLLVGAGLFLRTLRNLQAVDLGYSKDRLLQIRVDGEAAGYRDLRRADLFAELGERLRRIPGVRSVGFSENGLFAGTESGDRIIVEGFTPKRKEDENSRFDVVGAGYFSAIGIPMLLGSEFTFDDIARARKVCVVNQAFARTFFEGRNPIGRHITAQFGDSKRTYEVAGVSANARDHGLRGDVPPRYYVPVTAAGYVPASVNYQIRVSASPDAVLDGARRAIRERDESLPVLAARPVAELITARVSRERTIAELSAILGVIALVLACIGLYGVLSYGVARRTGEIGIRMALGARRREVIALIARETGWMVAAGIAGGLVAAYATTRLVTNQLYGVKPLDPATVGGSVGLLAVVALAAGFIPAFRASRVNPVIALRNE